MSLARALCRPHERVQHDIRVIFKPQPQLGIHAPIAFRRMVGDLSGGKLLVGDHDRFIIRRNEVRIHEPDGFYFALRLLGRDIVARDERLGDEDDHAADHIRQHILNGERNSQSE